MLARLQNIIQPVTPPQPKRWTGLRYMIDYWQMNESSTGVASVTRTDWLGLNPFSDPSFVPSATGIISNGANFVAASPKGLNVASNSGLQMGASPFGCTFWVKFGTPAANMAVIGKGSNTNSTTNMEWFVSLQAAPRFIFRVTDGVTVGAVTAATTSLVGATWYFVSIWWDGANINIQVDNGTIFSAAWTNALATTATPLRAGSSNQAGRFLDGVLDEVGLFKGGFLDSTERTFLYNGGAGKAPPFAA